MRTQQSARQSTGNSQINSAPLVHDSDNGIRTQMSMAFKQPSRQTTKNTQIPIPKQSQPLFFNSDDDVASYSPKGDDEDLEGGVLSETGMTLQSSAFTSQASPVMLRGVSERRTRKVPAVADDDSDDGATFQGFRGSRRGVR